MPDHCWLDAPFQILINDRRSKISNSKKTAQLGEPYGTASNRLRKQILFSLLAEFNRNICFQCNKQIEKFEELSVEHKEPWLDSDDPKARFFDLQNIAFSHNSCNSGAARSAIKKYFSKEERHIADCANDKRYKQKTYTKEARHAQYVRTGK